MSTRLPSSSAAERLRRGHARLHHQIRHPHCGALGQLPQPMRSYDTPPHLDSHQPPRQRFPYARELPASGARRSVR